MPRKDAKKCFVCLEAMGWAPVPEPYLGGRTWMEPQVHLGPLLMPGGSGPGVALQKLLDGDRGRAVPQVCFPGE